MKTVLTERIVADLKFDGKLKSVFDEKFPGLFVRVGSRAKVYYLFYRDKSGKQFNHKIGDTAALSISEAREQATKLKAQLYKGEDIKPNIQKTNTILI